MKSLICTLIFGIAWPSFAIPPLKKSVGPEILCEFLLVSDETDISNSPAYTTVMNRLNEDLKEIKLRKFELMMKLNASLLRRHEAQPSIPLMAAETESAIREFSALKGLERSVFGDGFEKVKVAVLKDPYFLWLKTNAADNRVMRSNMDSLARSGRLLTADPVPKDPIRLLFFNTTISGPSYLPLEMSKVLVYRDLDPELSTQQIDLANEILALQKLENIYANHLIGKFGNTHLMNQAWALAPTIAAAKTILARVDSELRAKVALEFPESAYQKTLIWFNNPPPDDRKVMRELESSTYGGRRLAPKEESELRAKVRKICDRLGIGESFDPLDMNDVARWLALQNIRQDFSYTQFLILYYGNSDLDSFTLNLKDIIEILSVVSLPEAFAQFVGGLISNGSFRY